jgi:hypothetical protein
VCQQATTVKVAARGTVALGSLKLIDAALLAVKAAPLSTLLSLWDVPCEHR